MNTYRILHCVSGDPIQTSTPDGSIIVKHREYLGTFDNVSDSAIQTSIVSSMALALTPESMYFEWINRMSDMYTFWRWRALKYKFKSKLSAIVPAGVGATTAYSLTQRPTVTAFCDYDARNFSKYTEPSTLPSKNAMLDSQGGKSVEFTQDFDYVIQCGGGIAGGALFSPIEGSKDIQTLSDREVNFGTLVVRFDGNVPFSTGSGCVTQMYDVWAEYEIEFVKPKSVDLFNTGGHMATGYAHYTLDVVSQNADIASGFATPDLVMLGGQAAGTTAATRNYGFSPFVASATTNSALCRKIYDNIGVTCHYSMLHFHPTPKDRYLITVIQSSAGGGTGFVAGTGIASCTSAGAAFAASSGGNDRLIGTDRGVWTATATRMVFSVVVEAANTIVPGPVFTGQALSVDNLPSSFPVSTGGAHIAHELRLTFGGVSNPYNATTALTESHIYIVALGAQTN